jgi:hypothetical protein
MIEALLYQLIRSYSFDQHIHYFYVTWRYIRLPLYIVLI